MDNNLLLAIVSCVSISGSTAGVAITALMISYKRLDRVEASLDRLRGSMDARFNSMDARFNSVDTRLDMLTGALHEIGKRLSILADRVGR